MSTIAVTGCASGIGAALRTRLEAQGATVIGVDLRSAEVVADLSKTAGRRAAVRDIVSASGGRLDGFVACAGVGPATAAAANIVSINYYGTVELLDALRDSLATRDGASAVVVSSNSATTVPSIPDELVEAILAGDEGSARWAAEDVAPTTAYAASKLAVARAMRKRAPEWAQAGVRLNAVAPGAVETPLLDETLADRELGPLVRAFPIPAGRFGKPSEVAAAIAFLLSPQAAFCHGSILFVDGGTDALVRPDRF